MKKWMIFGVIAVLIVVTFTYITYHKAVKPKKAAFAELEQAAEREGLAETDEYYLYHGSKSYSVAVGKDKSGKRKVLWIPSEKNGDVIKADYDSGITRQQVINQVRRERKPDKILSVKLGMENDVPLWEVIYQNEAKQINYEYFDFKTGDMLKYYRSI
ncbi:DUF5590 domain-containing protein [Peribacillus sp. SCS-37]|uniref:cell wall elongation regulator TseB-like domain-containing protein n=1 Tax=Paraperibacillus esterisolvens TaxID=3115296 RepID=UPI0039057C23